METLEDVQMQVGKSIFSEEQIRASSSLTVEESVVKYDKHPFLNGIPNPELINQQFPSVLSGEDDEATQASLFLSN
jgi:hypothetical protein